MLDTTDLRTKLSVFASVAALGFVALGGIGLWAAGDPSAAWARWLIGAGMVFTSVGVIVAALALMRSTALPIAFLEKESERIQKAVLEGDFAVRAAESGLPPEFRRIAVAMNGMLEAAGDKAGWYVAILDAVPFPIHVTDADMKWTFMNKPFEALMIREGRVKDRKQAVGMACSNAP